MLGLRHPEQEPVAWRRESHYGALTMWCRPCRAVPANPRTEACGNEWTQQQRQATFLDHLERRRNSFDQFMWNAPALTIAAQAFLLGVLTDDAVARSIQRWVAIAGILASVAAIVSLLRLRAREFLYSTAIAHYCDAYGIPDPRPDALAKVVRDEQDTRIGVWAWIDRQMRRVISSPVMFPVYWLWIVALAVFIAADVVAYY